MEDMVKNGNSIMTKTIECFKRKLLFDLNPVGKNST